MAVMKIAVSLPYADIEKFCHKWQIEELAVFGSVLRDDFSHKNSDIDVLVTFAPEAIIGWEIVDIKEELEKIFQRRVDLVEKEAVVKSKNPYRRDEILNSYEVIYAQQA